MISVVDYLRKKFASWDWKKTTVTVGAVVTAVVVVGEVAPYVFSLFGSGGGCYGFSFDFIQVNVSVAGN